jgi:hypothetical protein
MSFCLLLACFDVQAYQTELSLQSIASKFSYEERGPYINSGVAQASGTALHIDHAFTEHVTDGVPLAESQYFHPQSHVYFTLSDNPLMETAIYDYFIGSNAANTMNVGGDYYFYHSQLFIGGNYKLFDGVQITNGSESSINVGAYPLKGLRIMLALHRLNGFWNNTDGSISIKYLSQLNADYALSNEFSVVTSANHSIDYDRVSYDGAFYFNTMTYLSYGYETVLGNKLARDSENTYKLGFGHFINALASVDLRYKNRAVDNAANLYGETELRVLDIHLRVKF